jgi:hypothetical protein
VPWSHRLSSKKGVTNVSYYVDRHEKVGFCAVVLGVCVPIAYSAVALFCSAWLFVLGIPAHPIFWNWLSEVRHRGTTYQEGLPNGKVILMYYLGIGTLYLVWQCWEGLWALFRQFKYRLSRPVGFR